MADRIAEINAASQEQALGVAGELSSLAQTLTGQARQLQAFLGRFRPADRRAGGLERVQLPEAAGLRVIPR